MGTLRLVCFYHIVRVWQCLCLFPVTYHAITLLSECLTIFWVLRATVWDKRLFPCHRFGNNSQNFQSHLVHCMLGQRQTGKDGRRKSFISGDLQQQDLHHHGDMALKMISSSYWEAWRFCMTVTRENTSCGSLDIGSHKKIVSECLGAQARQPPAPGLICTFFTWVQTRLVILYN